MLAWEEDVEAHALREQGWTISAIARHLGRDRKTVRAYLNGERTPGVRATSADDPFDVVAGFVARRLQDDPHVWASALFDEVVALGYPRAYSTFTRQVRVRRLRPVCPACTSSGPDVATTEIVHPPGVETQWDWVELPGAPWLDGGTALLLVGVLSYSGRFRGVFADSMEQPQTLDAIDRTVTRLGGVTARWRFDRMASVVGVGHGRVVGSFGAFAKHYSVAVDLCPPRRAKRKGVVEKAVHYAAQRWWRTAAVNSPEEAQRSFDVFCATIGDARARRDPDGVPSTVGKLAGDEQLRTLPATRFPIQMTSIRKVTPDGTVWWRGNRYSVDPALIGRQVEVRVTPGTDTLDVVDNESGLLARHRTLADGQGAVVRACAHAVALERAVLKAFTTARPCHRKDNRPPSEEAKALADQIRGGPAPGDAVVIDLADWARHVPEDGR